jgi:hypothetical protein
MPTPTTPAEAVVTADDLGITGWTDTEVSWSPTGDQFLLLSLRGEDQFDFYFLVRPPGSPTASFKLSRTTFGSLDWSPDGRYLSYIDQDAEGNPGPVQVIDTTAGIIQPRELLKGPCTNAAWLSASKLIAACGLAVYSLSPDGNSANPPEPLYKLDGGRFPGSTMDLLLIARALPSPDGKQVAMYGLARQKSSLPLGEIGFVEVGSGKFNLLDRNNRAVAMVDWTPDSKYLVLRNIMGDWAVPYTFDFYLADPARQRIVQNLTKSNDKCDPVLGTKPDCQGLQPSAYQVERLLFAPDGNRYLFTGKRYIAQPGVALDTAERLAVSALSGAKADKPTELTPGDHIIGATWLPNGHYFYTRSPLKGSAVPVLDGQPATLKSAALSTLIKSGTPQAKTPRATATGTRIAASNQPFTSNAVLEAPQSEGTPSTFLTPSPTSLGQSGAAVPPTPAPTGPTDTPGPTTVPPSPTATQPVVFPSVTTSVGPAGTQILKVYTATPEAKAPTVPRSAITPKGNAGPSPTPDTVQLRPIAFYASPMGNWVISVERIAGTDKSVQFQLRLIPFSVK